MKIERIGELRGIANEHSRTRSALIIHECLDEIKRLQDLYCIALDAAYKGFPKKAQALGKLKRLAQSCQNTGS